MDKIAIIIPAHNEEKRIPGMLDNYLSYFKNLKEKGILDFKFIIVGNACSDNTCSIAKSYNKENIKVIEFERGGKGFAIIKGFEEALKEEGNLIGFVDADMATPPNAFYGLIKNIKNYDGVIANRWDKKSKIKKQTLLRRFLSRGFNFIVRSFFLFSYRDTQCGAKLFKKELIEKIYLKLGSSEWSFDVDLLFYSKREKAKIKSIPTEWHDKECSRINIKRTPLTMFLSTVRLRLLHSPFRFVVRAYRMLPNNLKFH